MTQVGHFEKVSYEQYAKALCDVFGLNYEENKGIYADSYEVLELPTRATSGSAGYDFHSTIGVRLAPGETAKIPTGIRVKIDDGWFLMCVPRSSLGFKYRMQLDNTCGIIDADYYYSDNEGHIFCKVTNDSKSDKVLEINFGDRFCQGIFLPYGITYGDNASAIRNGGMGSTN